MGKTPIMLYILIFLLLLLSACEDESNNNEYAYLPPTADAECEAANYCDSSLGYGRSICRSSESRYRGCKGYKPCTDCNPYSNNLISETVVNENHFFPISSDPSKIDGPIFWNKFESIDITNNCEISKYQPYYIEGAVYNSAGVVKTTGGIFSIMDGKFGKAICAKTSYVGQNGNSGYQVFIKPFGNNKLNWNKGTISAWIYVKSISMNGGSYGTSSGRIGGVQKQTSVMNLGKIPNSRFWSVEWNYYQTDYLHPIHQQPPCIALLYNGKITKSPIFIQNEKWMHLYIVWDNEGLTSGAYIRVFVNSSEVLWSAEKFPDASSEELNINLFSYITNLTAISAIDNIKIWDFVYTEDPSIEYNYGKGREEWY